MDAIYAHARFDYLDLGARSMQGDSGSAKANKISVECSGQLSKQ